MTDHPQQAQVDEARGWMDEYAILEDDDFLRLVHGNSSPALVAHTEHDVQELPVPPWEMKEDILGVSALRPDSAEMAWGDGDGSRNDKNDDFELIVDVESGLGHQMIDEENVGGVRVEDDGSTGRSASNGSDIFPTKRDSVDLSVSPTVPPADHEETRMGDDMPPPIPPRKRPPRRTLTRTVDAGTNRGFRVVGLTENHDFALINMLQTVEGSVEAIQTGHEQGTPTSRSEAGVGVVGPDGTDWASPGNEMPDIMDRTTVSVDMSLSQWRAQKATFAINPYGRESFVGQADYPNTPLTQRSFVSISPRSPRSGFPGSEISPVHSTYPTRSRETGTIRERRPIFVGGRSTEPLNLKIGPVYEDSDTLLTPPVSGFEWSPTRDKTTFTSDVRVSANGGISGTQSPTSSTNPLRRKYSLPVLFSRLSPSTRNTPPASPSSRSFNKSLLRMPSSPSFLKSLIPSKTTSSLSVADSSDSGSVTHSPSSSFGNTSVGSPLQGSFTASRGAEEHTHISPEGSATIGTKQYVSQRPGPRLTLWPTQK